MHFNLKNYGFGFAIFLIVIFQTEGFSKQVFSKKLMGTEVQIMVDADDSPSLKNAVNSAFKEGKRLNLILSDYDATSELSRLSRSSENGNPFTISKELLEVLTFGQQLAQISNGAFDVTMGPLTRLWRIARHQKKLPATEKINLALGRTGYQKLLINKSPPSATLTVPGMVLDLGGIAKGYVADRMLEVMRAEGYSRCLIDAGGDLTIGDPPRSRQGWRVQMGGLLTKELPLLELSNCAVATSGDLEQFLEIDGKRFSHIIDPTSGIGLRGRSQISLVAPNGITADSYASACLLLGPDGAPSLLKNLSFYKAYYLRAEKPDLECQLFEFHHPPID